VAPGWLVCRPRQVPLEWFPIREAAAFKPPAWGPQDVPLMKGRTMPVSSAASRDEWSFAYFCWSVDSTKCDPSVAPSGDLPASRRQVARRFGKLYYSLRFWRDFSPAGVRQSLAQKGRQREDLDANVSGVDFPLLSLTALALSRWESRAIWTWIWTWARTWASFGRQDRSSARVQKPGWGRPSKDWLPRLAPNIGSQDWHFWAVD
jgi:hypothetical protein